MNNGTSLHGYIDQIIDLLSSNPRLQKYFGPGITTLEGRRKRWDNDTVFIGMVGVTGSGKSTLINALFGESLLPARVKPSSGCLVWCSEDDEKKAVIKFKNDTELELTGGDLTYDRISEYADESHNVKNMKEVGEIKITSPRFLFRKGTIIVDSPGLDAYGLDEHEEITLKRLIPLMDICYIIVPAKPNSDQRFIEYIGSAIKAEKPVIIIQNMIDSLEPEIGPKGVIRKSLAEVKEEHRSRIRKNIMKAGIDPNKVNILQVSALYALNGRISNEQQPFIDSNLQSLIDLTKEFIEKRKPKIEAGRIKTIQIYLEEKVLGLDPQTELLPGSGINPDRVAHDSQEIRKNIDRFNFLLRDINERLHRSSGFRENAKDAIRNLQDNDIEGARNIILDVTNTFSKFEAEILETVDQADDMLRRIINALNLTEEEFKVQDPVRTGFQWETRDLSTTRTGQKVVDQNTWTGWAKRKVDFFGLGWGKRTEEYTITELNKEAAVSEIQQRYDVHSNRFLSSMRFWTSIRNDKQHVISDEFEQILRQEEIRKQFELEKGEMETILSRLREIFSDMNNNLDLVNPADDPGVEVYNESGEKEANSEVGVKKVTLWLHRLSHQVVQKAARELALSEPYLQKARVFCFAGWNEDALSTFVSRSFGVEFNTKSIDGDSEGFHRIESPEGTILLLNCRVANDETQDKVTDIILEECVPLYLLVNPHQIGSTRKQLENSRFIQRTAAGKALLVPVIENLREIRNSGAIHEMTEAVFEVWKMLQNKGFEIPTVLINHPNPVFSRLMIATYKNLDLSPEAKIKMHADIIRYGKRFLKDRKPEKLANEFSIALRNIK